MSEHSHDHDNKNIKDLYEGDQSKLYSGIMGHHTAIDSPESKKQVGRIWKIFWVLLVITILEVGMGLLFSYSMPRLALNPIFLILTVVKAGFIVYVFMHLGDERKNFLVMILIPLTLFIWFIIAFLADGHFWLFMNNTSPTR